MSSRILFSSRVWKWCYDQFSMGECVSSKTSLLSLVHQPFKNPKIQKYWVCCLSHSKCWCYSRSFPNVIRLTLAACLNADVQASPQEFCFREYALLIPPHDLDICVPWPHFEKHYHRIASLCVVNNYFFFHFQSIADFRLYNTS